MIVVGYANEFIRQYGRLPRALQQEVKEKIELFKDRKNHAQLKVHKLHGKYKDCLAFSVNYEYRVRFKYIGKAKAVAILITVGDHDVYK